MKAPTEKDLKVAALADEQGSVLRLRQLRDAGISRGRQRAQVDAERWYPLPYRGVVVPTVEHSQAGVWWRAVTEVGTRAWLGGITALLDAGLTGYDEPLIHVWVMKSTPKGAPAGVQLHETRRWNTGDVVQVGVPRSTPAVATVQAALWARSARQAMLAMVMPVQQRIVRAEDVAAQLERIRRHRFRRVLQTSIQDILRGAQSLGELDFARECRRRGLPEPSRQEMRRTSQGRVYLDVYWKRYRVAVEVNGAGHSRPEQAMRDEIRAMDLQLREDAAVQVSLFTLRCDPEPFFAKLAELLAARGWHR